MPARLLHAKPAPPILSFVSQHQHLAGAFSPGIGPWGHGAAGRTLTISSSVTCSWSGTTSPSSCLSAPSGVTRKPADQIIENREYLARGIRYGAIVLYGTDRVPVLLTIV